MENHNSEKQYMFAEGIITYFNYSIPFDSSNKPTLFFDGEFLKDNKEKTGETLKRRIKISKYANGYNYKDKIPLLKNSYPLINHVYKGKIKLETWEWNNYNCMRVISFEIKEDLGINKNYKQIINPFNE